MNHDVIVIGASAGGVEVLLNLAPGLRADLPASIFVVVHTVPGQRSPLPELLSARGPLPARHPLHGEEILPGHIYVAPSDNHLLVRRGKMEVIRGPKENGHRPSADALFRTASAAYGSRVIGVVLSGYQNCGTAGMMSIRARGGLCVVQAPASAHAEEMPRNVLDRVPVDHVVTPQELPALLARLAATPAGPSLEPGHSIAALEGRELGVPSNLVCPICTGVLTETSIHGFDHFRCHVGHTFSMESLILEQREQMERALWGAVRALEESASLNRRLSDTSVQDLRERFAEASRTYCEQADHIRRVLLGGVSFATDPGRATAPGGATHPGGESIS
jgi:two-component system, chemotaxis family, protein-glutamate methylesterase/glutaminase